MFFYILGDAPDDPGVGEHTCFDKTHRKKLKNGIQLFFDRWDRKDINSQYGIGILRRDRSYHRTAVNFEVIECPQICLDAGASSGVASGNGQD